jgi:hypothetical protein
MVRLDWSALPSLGGTPLTAGAAFFFATLGLAGVVLCGSAGLAGAVAAGARCTVGALAVSSAWARSAAERMEANVATASRAPMTASTNGRDSAMPGVSAARTNG